MAMTAQPVRWTVESQVEGYDTAAAGGVPVKGVRIGIVVNDLVHTSVFVPQNRYNPTDVKGMLDAAASAAWAIQTLSHSS